jgi:hypothetical protein
VVRPVPIPNTAVKHSLADGSSCIASARVGCRQIFKLKSRDALRLGFFLEGLPQQQDGKIKANVGPIFVLEVLDFNSAPFPLQIFGDQTTVAVMRLVFTAKQAPVVDQIPI